MLEGQEQRDNTDSAVREREATQREVQIVKTKSILRSLLVP